MNGIQVVSHHGPTASGSGENGIYNKIGLYRDRWSEPMTIYFDNYTLGERFADVDPSRFDRQPQGRGRSGACPAVIAVVGAGKGRRWCCFSRT